MPRRRNTDYIMYFNVDRYKAEIKKALVEANRKIKNLLLETVRRNVSALPFKDNPVKMADRSITSDLARSGDLLDSIIGDRVRTFSEWYGGVMLETSVTAMAKKFEDSHIGWYYEVGTGEESDASLYAKYGLSASLGDRNPYRLPNVGAPIVTRSRCDGTWRDLGGNVRITGSNVGGIGDTSPPPAGFKGTPERYAEIASKFREYIGPDIVAYRWFERAVEEVSEQILSIYIEAINSVDITDPRLEIFHVRDRIILGEKWWQRS